MLHRLGRLGVDAKTAKALDKKGFSSAHQIAAVSEDMFVNQSRTAFSGGEDQAKQVYAKAVHVKEGIKHVAAYIRSTMASPFYRALPSTKIDAGVKDYFTQAPSYQDLFGSLDYLDCEECASIFGPAAYFTDLMRLTDQGITQPNAATIPPNYKLEDRRPDLFDLQLTCSNTLTVIPYLRVVNRILGKLIEAYYQKPDAYKVAASVDYPINLPFLEPLTRIRRVYDQLQTPLATIYKTFKNESTSSSVTPVDIGRERVGLSVDELVIVKTVDSSVPSILARYGYDAGARLYPVPGTGTVKGVKGEKTLTGTGTTFTTQVKAGDQVRIGTQTRVVETIASDTDLTVDNAWTEDFSVATFEDLPQEGIFRVSEFLARTNLTNANLSDLFNQQLSRAEIDKGVADTLFINATGETLPRLSVFMDRGDPTNPTSFIIGLSDKRLDRLNRFIRLSNVLNWSYADVDWAIRVMGENPSGQITDELVVALGKILDLVGDSTTPVTQLAGLWSDLKTIGRVSDSNPQDPFDLIFNVPALLAGADPYKPGNIIPFDPFRTPVQKWVVDGKTSEASLIRSRLSAALNVSSDDLTSLATVAIALIGVKGTTIDLNIGNLSLMFRLAFGAQVNGLTVEQYLTLLCLLYYPTSPYLAPPANAVSWTLDHVAEISSYAVWLADQGIDVFELKYLLTAEGSPFFSPGYDPEEVEPFLASLVVTAKGSRLKPNGFAYDSITEDESQIIFATLVAAKILSPLGLVYVAFRSYFAGPLFPFTPVSFADNSITDTESKEAYKALVDNSVLVESTVGQASISPTYTHETSIDFLKTVFTGPNAATQIESVRTSLDQAKASSDRVFKVLSDAYALQSQNVATGLSAFLGIDKNITAATFPVAQQKASLPDFVVTFLTPIVGTVDEKVFAFIGVENRVATTFVQVNFKANEITPILGLGSHFDISDFGDMTIRNVRTLTDYRAFTNTFGIKKNELLAYFELPDDAVGATDCSKTKKVKKLASLTAWERVQICQLIGLFWPVAPVSGLSGYDKMSGLMRMNSAFNVSRAVGQSIAGLIALLAISHLPVRKSDKSIDDANWTVYSDLATQAMAIVNGKFGASESEEVNAEIDGDLNTAIRDHFLGLTLWNANKRLPHIQTVSDLYQYLLIDLEVSSCFDTSLIQQAISSVQLYMQRCRMMQEPGVLTIKLRKIWWTWFSNYRVWEANRRIYLYPENYIDPTLRSTATPLFKTLMQDLQQQPITKDNVVAPFDAYLQGLDVLANLQHCAAYNATIKDPDVGDKSQRLYLIARSQVEPEGFYYRVLDSILGWGPFYSINLNIASKAVAPTYAFERLFLFWLEQDMGQSSSIKEMKSDTETLRKFTLRYSFLSNGGSWVQPQVASSNVVARAYENNYDSLDNSQIIPLLNPANMPWVMPFALSMGNGYVGAGRISVVGGQPSTIGINSQFDRELHIGDQIWCNGEFRTVEFIGGQTSLVVNEPWTSTAATALYRVIPGKAGTDPKPFIGEGTVTPVKDTETVLGQGTDFLSTFNLGDKIGIGTQIREVVLIGSAVQLLVDTPFVDVGSMQPYTAIPSKVNAERLMVMVGDRLPTSYSQTFKPPTDQANPGLNFFIGQRNAFNQSIYDTLSTAREDSSLGADGVVTLGPAFVFNQNLISSKALVTVADDKFAAASVPPGYQGVLDRDRALFGVAPSGNSIADNYWSNSLAGTADDSKGKLTSSALSLLYYVSSRNASSYGVANQTGWYLFNNSDESFLVQSQEQSLNTLTDMLFLGVYPAPDLPANLIATAGARTPRPTPFNDLRFKFTRLTTATVPTLMQRLLAGGIDNLLTVESQLLPELPFSRFYQAGTTTPPPAVIPPPTDRLDFDGSFGLYFKELFFHAPFLVGTLLAANRRHEDAKAWFEYIFNPLQEADPLDADDNKRYWRYLPFRSLTQESLYEILTNKAQIARYNDFPFDPDVIADLRPSAYAKAVVMKYVDNLIQWGDLLFSQDTRESINQATNLYVLAADLLGPRPISLGKRETPKPITFREIRAHYPDGIPQFLIDLESSSFSLWDMKGVELDSVPINDITSYFCVPENSDLMQYWDRIEDRLFKIRHCMNIAGVVRSLALFEPPIDPRQLIRAMASGGGLASLAAQLKPNVPFYKFDYLLDKAKEFASQLQGYGSSLQSAYESKSAADLELLQIRQQKRLLSLTASSLKQEVQEAEATLKSLNVTLEAANNRKTYFQDLVSVGGGVSTKEQISMDAQTSSIVLQTAAVIAETAAAINYSLPQVGSPFALTYGGEQLGNTLTAVGGALNVGSSIANAVSERIGTMGTYDRRKAEWEQEVKQATSDINQITAEISAAEFRVKVAQQQVAVNEETVRQADETELFLKSKFTNADLFQWMITQYSSLYFQSYGLAYQLALSAQQAFQFEQCTDESFLSFGYWNDRAAGLLAADGLLLSLYQMDNARLQRPLRYQEITKEVSLVALDPLEFLRFRSTGECVIRLPEKLFDYDFPGQYCRRIRTLLVTLVAEDGAITSVSATLTQLSNYVVVTADKRGLNAVDYLLGGKTATTPGPDVLRSNWVNNQEVALSSGVDDPGMFEIDFYSTGYLPFEGTGVVSTWRLSMPPEQNRFDYGVIQDVTFRILYTARSGGATFRSDVMKLAAYKPYTGSLFIEFATMYEKEWAQFEKDHSSQTTQTLTFDIDSIVPPHIKNAKVTSLFMGLSATASAPGSYIAFAVTSSVTLPVDITPENGWNYGFKEHQKPEPSVDAVTSATHTIVFDLNKTPDDLKDSDKKYLDFSKLLDIQLVLFYEGEAASA